MIVPYDSLPSSTLSNVIKDWLSRQSQESLSEAQTEQEMVDQVVALLKAGHLLVTWDDESQTINLVSADSV
jgi:uncharacterized protein YheU (UPF0270 family)